MFFSHVILYFIRNNTNLHQNQRSEYIMTYINRITLLLSCTIGFVMWSVRSWFRTIMQHFASKFKGMSDHESSRLSTTFMVGWTAWSQVIASFELCWTLLTGLSMCMKTDNRAINLYYIVLCHVLCIFTMIITTA